MEKQVVNLTIFLIKEHITDLKDCLKAPDTLSSSNIKHEYGMEGTMLLCIWVASITPFELNC